MALQCEFTNTPDPICAIIEQDSTVWGLNECMAGSSEAASVVYWLIWILLPKQQLSFKYNDLQTIQLKIVCVRLCVCLCLCVISQSLMCHEMFYIFLHTFLLFA
jgi:hypothetical protein